MRYALLTSVIMAAVLAGCATPAPQLPSHAPQLSRQSYGVITDVQSDHAAGSRYLNRYTVTLGDGEVRYLDETKNTKFRHSVGVCVSVPDLKLLSQKTCR